MKLYDLYDIHNVNQHLPIEGPILWTYEKVYGRDVKCGMFNFIGESYRVTIKTLYYINLKGMTFSIEIFDKQRQNWTTSMPLIVNKEASKVIGVIAPEIYTLLRTEYKDVDFVVFVGPFDDKCIYSWFIDDMYRAAQFGCKSFDFK